MKNKGLLLGVSLMLLSAGACTTNELQVPEETLSETSLKGVVAIMPSVDDSDTKSNASETSGKLNFSWSDDDVLGIVPLDGKTPQTNYEMSVSDEGTAATFDGGSWSVKSGREYAAYLPYQPVVATSSDMISISLDNQVQVGNNDVSHLGNYNIMYASGTATADDAIQLNFNRLSGFFRFEMEGLPAGTYTSVIVSTNDAVLARSAELDLENGTLIPKDMTNAITLHLEDVTLEDNEVLNAWMASAPVAIANKAIKVTAVSTEGSVTYIFKTSSDLASNKTKWPVLAKTAEFCQLPEGHTFKGELMEASGYNDSNIQKIIFKTGRVVSDIEKGYDIICNSETKEVTVSTNSEMFKLNQDSRSMFESLFNLREIEGLDLLNTSEVVNMNNFFSSCINLQSVDLSTFVTSSVTDMSEMFESCQSLTTLDISNFDVSHVENMAGMFNDCKTLETLNLGEMTTSCLTSLRNTFADCRSLKSLDLFKWDVSNVTDMAYMFSKCYALETLSLPGSMADNLINVERMFQYCSSLTTLFLMKMNTSKVTSMSNVFNGCTKLQTLDLCGWDLSKVTDFTNMFNSLGKDNDFETSIYCSEETWYNMRSALRQLSNDKYTIVLDPLPDDQALLPEGHIFNGYLSEEQLLQGDAREIYAVKFHTAADINDITGEKINKSYPGIYITSYKQSGEVCIDVWTAAKEYVLNEDSSHMFEWMSLRDLDLSDFDASNVTSMEKMFKDCEYLKRINLGDKFLISEQCNTSNMINGAGATAGSAWFFCLDDTWDKLTSSGTGYTPGRHFRGSGIASFPADQKPGGGYETIRFITNSSYSDASELLEGTGEENLPIYKSVNAQGTVVTYYTSAKEFTLPADCSQFFMTMGANNLLTTIEGLDKLNTSNVTNMGGMFKYTQLRELDLSSWDTSNVTNMNHMFYEMRQLEELDMSSFNTINVTTFDSMFYDLLCLHTLRLSPCFVLEGSYTRLSITYNLGKYVEVSEHDGFNTTFYNCSKATFEMLIPPIVGDRNYRLIGGYDNIEIIGGNSGDPGDALYD